MLAVFEVWLQLVEPKGGRAAEAGVITGDLQLGKHVTHDAGDGSKVGKGHDGAVHGADLLLCKPLCDAGITEGMLTVRGLREQTDWSDRK